MNILSDGLNAQNRDYRDFMIELGRGVTEGQAHEAQRLIQDYFENNPSPGANLQDLTRSLRSATAAQGGADQPTTNSKSMPEGEEKPKPESGGRSQ